MANEWTLVTRKSYPESMTVADGTGINRGTLLKATDPNTAIIVSAAGDMIAGVAAAEKIASDGVTSLAVYKDGVFKATLSGSCIVGQALYNDAVPNMVRATATANLSGSRILGYAKETGATGETILVELKIGSGGVA